MDPIVEDISVLSRCFVSFNVFHVKRVGNCVAYFVARLFPLDGRKKVFVDSFPQGALTLAEMDID